MLLPHGQELPAPSWDARHRFIVWTALAHAPALALFGWWQDWPAAYWLVESLLIAAIALVATRRELSRRLRAALAGLALVTSSAVLVQFSGGYIEAHFHYFIVVALVALYEDYVPFLLAIGYVAFDHGIVGSLAPGWVYNHEQGTGEPWKWATIHAAAILGESVALLGFWAGSQQVRARSDVVLDSTGEGIVGTSLERQHPDRKVGWDVQPGLETRGDEGLLRLALENLLSNAWKFTSKVPEARIRVHRDSARAHTYVVEDNGAGFNMADAGDLFQPFHRLHEANEFPGTGIGLATVGRILHRHGGLVWAESSPGKGARFLFTIPDAPSHTAERGTRPKRPLVELVSAPARQ